MNEFVARFFTLVTEIVGVSPSGIGKMINIPQQTLFDAFLGLSFCTLGGCARSNTLFSSRAIFYNFNDFM